MLKEVKCRKFSVKSIVILSALLLIAVCSYAQAPEWEWATQAGGIGWDEGCSITIDNAGNTYVTGCFEDTVSFGTFSLTSSGSADIFVAKMNVDGTWQWATKAGGTARDGGNGIKIDDLGNIYVTGYFKDTVLFGSYSITSYGGTDIFVAKMDSTGNWLWTTSAGGSGNDCGYDITIDSARNSYVIGYFKGNASFGSNTLISNGYQDIFVAKTDMDGNWQWATKAGAEVVLFEDDVGYGITNDIFGNCYVTGNFSSTATFGSHFIISNGNTDIFVAKINADGNWCWAKTAGGTSYDRGFSITIDDNENCYLTGCFIFLATFGSYCLTGNGDHDIFVAKIDENGNWQWANKAGGDSWDVGLGITIDNTGCCYVTGHFKDSATFGSNSINSSGNSDIFIAKTDAYGNWLWATKAGGSSYDIGYAIAIDDAGNSYVTGCFMDTATFGSDSLSGSGGPDIFVAKLGNETSVENEIIPIKMELSNYPNPFNTNTVISYTLKKENEVRLEIYNLKGQLVETLLKGNIQAGDHAVEWDCQNIPTGIYFLKMRAGNDESVRKLVLLR